MKLQHSTGLTGTITVPGDKSVSHRAVMLGALSDGVTHVFPPSTASARWASRSRSGPTMT